MRWIGTGIIRKWFTQHRRRGATLPFEAPALRMAQVCEDERDGLVAVLHDFANNGSTYIVPWTSLPLMASMTAHDVALHKAIGESKASTPAQVRVRRQPAGALGSLGPGGKGAGARAHPDGPAARRSRADTFIAPAGQLRCGPCDPDGGPRSLARHGRQSRVAAAAKAVALKRQHIYRRIAEFAKLLAPVGLTATDGAIQSGWLRVLHDEIEGFGRERRRHRSD